MRIMESKSNNGLLCIKGKNGMQSWSQWVPGGGQVVARKFSMAEGAVTGDRSG